LSFRLLSFFYFCFSAVLRHSSLPFRLLSSRKYEVFSWQSWVVYCFKSYNSLFFRYIRLFFSTTNRKTSLFFHRLPHPIGFAVTALTTTKGNGTGLPRPLMGWWRKLRKALTKKRKTDWFFHRLPHPIGYSSYGKWKKNLFF
jgi:hypothetical protein